MRRMTTIKKITTITTTMTINTKTGNSLSVAGLKTLKNAMKSAQNGYPNAQFTTKSDQKPSLNAQSLLQPHTQPYTLFVKLRKQRCTTQAFLL